MKEYDRRETGGGRFHSHSKVIGMFVVSSGYKILYAKYAKVHG